jgi:hypothetical protein
MKIAPFSPSVEPHSANIVVDSPAVLSQNSENDGSVSPTKLTTKINLMPMEPSEQEKMTSGEKTSSSGSNSSRSFSSGTRSEKERKKEKAK